MSNKEPLTEDNGEGAGPLQDAPQPKRKKTARSAGQSDGTARFTEDLAREQAAAQPAVDLTQDEISGRDIEAQAYLPSEDTTAAVFEAAVGPEIEVIEELSKEGLQAADAAAISFAENLRKFAVETASYSVESMEAGSAFASDILQAKSLPEALKVQFDFARATCVRLLEYIGKVSGLYWSLIAGGSQSLDKGAAKADG